MSFFFRETVPKFILSDFLRWVCVMCQSIASFSPSWSSLSWYCCTKVENMSLFSLCHKSHLSQQALTRLQFSVDLIDGLTDGLFCSFRIFNFVIYISHFSLTGCKMETLYLPLQTKRNPWTINVCVTNMAVVHVVIQNFDLLNLPRNHS